MQIDAERPQREVGLALVGLIFFMSGFPALVYQLVWQRSLFTIYGINVESVTVIVTAFMLGLGLGSLVGGAISRRERLPLLLVFGAIEFGIGLFGAFSIALFQYVGEFTLHFSPFAIAAVTLGLVVVPTMLMGATLPILTAYLVGRSGNVGRSVGFLYFVNTLGSAAACFVCAVVLMRVAGIQGSVMFAASLNAIVGVGAILLWTRRHDSAARIGSSEAELTDPAPASNVVRIGFAAALLVAGAAGFISLSYEIVWFRVFSFASATSPVAFAAILGAYLGGIAFGSLGARRYCGPVDTGGRALAIFVLLANSVGFVMIPSIAFFASHGLGYLFWSLGLIAIHAGLLGATFPLISHYAIPPDRHAGRRLSYVYFANIVGSASGSLITGFVLFDLLEIRQITVLLTLLGLLLGVVLLLGAREPRNRRIASIASVGALAVLVVASSGALFHDFYARLLFKEEYGTVGLTDVVENKHGVITVTELGLVFGGGGYDGNLHPADLRQQRPFFMTALHPKPSEVLVIGLATGTWAQIIANHPQVERITIVEINPGYLGLIGEYDSVRSLLESPKVEIIIDDGRRWLNRHPESRFDFILSNTSQDWRANATNLLSDEFLTLVRRHLNPGGVFFYNTLIGKRTMRTACTSFPHGMRVDNHLAVSATPIDFSPQRMLEILPRYQIDGKAVIDPSSDSHRTQLRVTRERLGDLGAGADHYLEDCSSILERTEGFPTVTDDNMATEWIVPPRGEPVFEYLIAMLKDRDLPVWLSR